LTGDEDVADRFFAQDAAVLKPGAFGLLRVDLETGGIIDNQNAVRGRPGSGLPLDQGDSFVVELQSVLKICMTFAPLLVADIFCNFLPYEG